ncbi:MarR family winged helix-turn-helix transcriptional regulator [Janthinobacterium agaricidamnosum]|uniref:MarR family protein n=1 Tax=Janthinobacterium agaricidamnosum NBRC 102515 = DSM 9628 TaxID=1349767 RepID=W0V040_9BURK|nr:MarR family transcriptional regulator [Janthinobacterium agaricidamnosum]CDG80965.1 marR family protein [Janthinobacterium agaricidamnosum NBRC 102515 = DSM 9628]
MQGFERFAGEYVRKFGLTHAQFDIIATLGNTPGMTFKELGQKTLITKGTLTGVVERLEQKGLISRQRCTRDKRSYFVRLTDEGDQVFGEVFPAVTSKGKRMFSQFSDDDFSKLEQTLSDLKDVIDAGGCCKKACKRDAPGTDKK